MGCGEAALHWAPMSRWLLLIDDDEDNRELLKEFLELGGHSVVSCGSAVEANAILAQRGKPCVVVTDVRLPDTSGTVFVEQLRSRRGFANIPVIFVTGTDPRTLGHLEDPVLTKPFDLEALTRLIAERCEGPAAGDP